jgi:hypothetical protein
VKEIVFRVGGSFLMAAIGLWAMSAVLLEILEGKSGWPPGVTIVFSFGTAFFWVGVLMSWLVLAHTTWRRFRR